jgi:hypothetical protein
MKSEHLSRDFFNMMKPDEISCECLVEREQRERERERENIPMVG